MTNLPPLDLTFGVEIEFLLGYFRDPRFDPYIKELQAKGSPIEHVFAEYHAEKTNHRIKIMRKLREVGIDVNDYREINTTRWSVEADGSVCESDEDKQTMTPRFANGSQLQLTDDGRGYLKYCDVEVKSGVLRFNQDSLREIQKVVDTIVSNFMVFVNDTCGLHIHVGNKTLGFPIQTVKTFATLVTCFQDQINQFHPLPRLQSEFCLLETTAFAPSEREPWRMAEIIDSFITIEKLIDHFGRHRSQKDIVQHNWCYNYNNLQWRPDRKTIEFRQHTGTLDAAAILRWAVFACSTVSVSHTVPIECIWELILECYDKNRETRWDVFELLRKLHLNFLADIYQGHCYQHPPDMPLNDTMLEDEIDDDYPSAMGKALSTYKEREGL